MASYHKKYKTSQTKKLYECIGKGDTRGVKMCLKNGTFFLDKSQDILIEAVRVPNNLEIVKILVEQLLGEGGVVKTGTRTSMIGRLDTQKRTLDEKKDLLDFILNHPDMGEPWCVEVSDLARFDNIDAGLLHFVLNNPDLFQREKIFNDNHFLMGQFLPKQNVQKSLVRLLNVYNDYPERALEIFSKDNNVRMAQYFDKIDAIFFDLPQSLQHIIAENSDFVPDYLKPNTLNFASTLKSRSDLLDVVGPRDGTNTKRKM